MILKTLKQKLNARYLNKILQTRRAHVAHHPMETLGIIFDANKFFDYEQIEDLIASITQPSTQVQVMGFLSKKEETHLPVPSFIPHDIGFYGAVKNEALKLFLATKFDVLINLYTTHELALKVVTAQADADLKVGVFQAEIGLNDLIIKTKLERFELFKTELIKYLTILKKI